MVLYHESYVRQGEMPQESATLDMASTIAETVLVHFGLRDLKRYQEFLSGTDTFDRGEVVEINSFLHTLI